MSNILTTGGCHCGCVLFDVQIPTTIRVQSCNCSICSKVGFLHLIVPAHQFRLLRGRDDLAEYRFNSGVAKHLFCRKCGIKSFYVPRSNPDGFSINLRCLQVPPEVKVIEENFDGRNWEQHADALRNLSRVDS